MNFCVEALKLTGVSMEIKQKARKHESTKYKNGKSRIRELWLELHLYPEWISISPENVVASVANRASLINFCGQA
jgi:hypothetical protein